MWVCIQRRGFPPFKITIKIMSGFSVTLKLSKKNALKICQNFLEEVSLHKRELTIKLEYMVYKLTGPCFSQIKALGFKSWHFGTCSWFLSALYWLRLLST